MRKHKEVKRLSTSEFVRLKAQFTSVRDLLILEILYETGCTVNELVKIKFKDIVPCKNDKKLPCHINFPATNTKTNRARISFISKALCLKLKGYISENNISRHLFTSRQSSQITTKRIRQIIQSKSKKAQLGKINPRIIRYTHIAHALEKGILLGAIQNQVGMERLRIVQIYEGLIPETKESVYYKFWNYE